MSHPNILSNKLDQAPKTGQYYQSVIDDIKPMIEESLDQFENISIDTSEEISQWLEKNRNKIPFKSIVNTIQGGGITSYEIERTNPERDRSKTFIETIGPMLHLDNIQLGKIFDHNTKTTNVPGDIITYLQFKKNSMNGSIQIFPLQIEYPVSGAFVGRGFVNIRREENISISHIQL